MSLGEANSSVGVILSPEVQKSSGYLFLYGACNYKKAAFECCPDLHDPQTAISKDTEWSALHDPVCNLYCHSIELMLKAFLMANGYNERKLARRPFAHDLAALANAGILFELGLTAKQVEFLQELTVSFGKQPYTFRYPAPGVRRLNFFHFMQSLVDEIYAAVWPAVLSKAQSMGTPAHGPNDGK